jgi:hypothetical protein
MRKIPCNRSLQVLNRDDLTVDFLLAKKFPSDQTWPEYLEGCSQKVSFSEMNGLEEPDAFKRCQRKRWIHPDLIMSVDGTSVFRYIIPSPLHVVCLSWRLVPVSGIPSFDSLFEMVVNIIP